MKTHQMFSVHTTPEEFEMKTTHVSITLKTHQMFSVYTTLEKQQSSAIQDLYLRKTRSVESRDYRDVISFRSVFKMFSIHTKTKIRRSW